MNCAAITAILDDHQTTRLEAAELTALDAHLRGCAPCAASWSAHEALRGEQMGEPPQDLLARALRRAAERGRATAGGRRRAVAFGVAAAVAMIAVPAVLVLAPSFRLSMNGLSYDAVVDARAWLTRSDASRDLAAGPEASAPVTAEGFVVGRDYEVLSRPAVAVAPGERVAVIEFFMWPCNHCYALESELQQWEAKQRGHVALTRVPVVFNRDAELYARAFYAAEALGKLDVIYPALYEELHVRGTRLASVDALAELFGRFDVDGATFVAALNSNEVDARVRQAVAMAREYRIQAVPALVVGGRYATKPTLAGPRLLELADYLVAQAGEAGCRGSTRATEQRSRAACTLDDLLTPVDPGR